MGIRKMMNKGSCKEFKNISQGHDTSDSLLLSHLLASYPVRLAGRPSPIPSSETRHPASAWQHMRRCSAVTYINNSLLNSVTFVHFST